MKTKIYLAFVFACLLLFPLHSFAQDSVTLNVKEDNLSTKNGFYLSTKGNLGMVNTWDYVDNYNSYLLGASFAAGYDLYPQKGIPVRVEFELGIYDTGVLDTAIVNTVTLDLSAFQQTYFVNGYYDFYNFEKAIPYVYGGLGLGRTKLVFGASDSTTTIDFETDYETNFGFNFGAGFAYPINDMLTFDAGGKFAYFGQVADIVNGVIHFNAFAGLRINF